MCIGNRMAMLELKTTMAHLCRMYTFKLNEEIPLELFYRITLAPETGVHVFLSKRTGV
jgi:cytochrome P450